MIPISNVNADTFCVGPYAEVRINSDGSLNFCHAADNTALPILDNVSKISILEYFHNADSVRNARKDLQQANALSRCHKCYSEEKLSQISWRRRRNLQAGIFPGPDFVQSLAESTFIDGFSQSSQPRFYHVSFSNLCNMACMMCNSKNSTKYDDFARRAGLSSGPVMAHDWTTGPAWPLFCDHLLNNHSILCLHVMGGEPMYHRRFKELINLLIQQQHCDFHFTVVTNGSVYDAEVLEMLSKFRSTVIEISIEGIGPENDYVRHTADIQQIQHNIKKILSHRSDRFDVVMRSVPQALTVLSYHDLLQFCLDHDLIIDSNPLYEPEFMGSHVLPDSIKQQVRENLARFAVSNLSRINQINLRNRHNVMAAISSNAQFVLSHLDRPVADLEPQRRQLAKHCATWDRARHFHVRDYVPALTDFLNRYGYNDNPSSR